MTDPDEPGDSQDYLAALIEERIANLSDNEFDMLCARTRPPKLDDQIKAAYDRGDVMTAIALKSNNYRLRNQPAQHQEGTNP